MIIEYELKTRKKKKIIICELLSEISIWSPSKTRIGKHSGKMLLSVIQQVCTHFKPFLAHPSLQKL